MNTTNSQVIPAPPSLFRSLIAGFDAISSHIALIVIPIVLDLLLWLGPHLSLERLVQSIYNQTMTLPELNTPETADMVKTSRDLWLVLAERFNLMGALRSYPVGIPSLMVTRSPQDTPWGAPLKWEIPSFGAVVGMWLLLVLIGLVIGAFYFSVISQVTLVNKFNFRQLLEDWPWCSLQVIYLALFWFVLLLAASIPFSCLLSLLFLTGIGVGQFVIFIIGGLLVWLLFPLVFSPHGIFVNRRGMWVSVKEGVRLTRMILPSAGLFFLAIVILSEGLDLLWRVPAEASWFTFVGVAGHAFVTSGLLAATFVYYRDANEWVQRMRQRAMLAS